MREEGLRPARQRIVIPQGVLDGLLVALHLQLQHASKHQLKQIFNMGFYALDTDKAINRTVDSCHTCVSLKQVPSQFKNQSSTKPPDKIGSWYASDVIKREGQLILLVRENVSSLTQATLLLSESSQSLKDGLITTISRFRPPSGDEVKIRVDGASGFQALLTDSSLESFHIKIEVGEIKNINKNPISESEFHTELCKLKPNGGKITDTELAIIISNMNSRFRENGYSSLEIWTMRDQITGEKLPIEYKSLIEEKHRNRLKRHESSAKYKGRGRTTEIKTDTKVGEIVYLYQDRVKTNARNKYMVMEVEDQYCTVQKFTDKQFRGKRYKVKKSDIIKVEQHPNYHTIDQNNTESEYEIDSPIHVESESSIDEQSDSSKHSDTENTQDDSIDHKDPTEETPPGSNSRGNYLYASSVTDPKTSEVLGRKLYIIN